MFPIIDFVTVLFIYLYKYLAFEHSLLIKLEGTVSHDVY